jgi:hypothetical protein
VLYYKTYNNYVRWALPIASANGEVLWHTTNQRRTVIFFKQDASPSPYNLKQSFIVAYTQYCIPNLSPLKTHDETYS